MEMVNRYTADKLNLLIVYLRLDSRTISTIKSNYRINSEDKNDFKKAMIKHYIRSNQGHTPIGFNKIEWIVAVLFFGLGENFNTISSLVERPTNDLKLSFFSIKLKLLSMTSSSD